MQIYIIFYEQQFISLLFYTLILIRVTFYRKTTYRDGKERESERCENALFGYFLSEHIKTKRTIVFGIQIVS